MTASIQRSARRHGIRDLASSIRLLLPVPVLLAIAAPAAARYGPDAQDLAWFLARPKAGPTRFYDVPPDRTRQCRIARMTRSCVLEPDSGLRSRPFEVQSDGTNLDLPFAALCPPRRDEPCHGDLGLEISIVESGVDIPAVIHRGSASHANPHWESARLDLARWVGKKVVLAIRAQHSGGDPMTDSARPALLVWGEPIAPSRLWAEPERPNVILISIDTLRADRLGSYGYTRPTSPNLDRLAEQGVRFESVTTQSPWTSPAHATMLTSRFPSSHGVNQSFARFSENNGSFRTLHEDTPTLASSLRSIGYETLAFVGGGTVSQALGFSIGFDAFDEAHRGLSDELLERLRAVLSRSGQQNPFFLFLHTFEVHAPYSHTRFAEPLMTPDQKAAIEDFQRGRYMGELSKLLLQNGLLLPEITSALYDGGIRFTDEFLGRLFSTLRNFGLYDDTLIVVTSDHGEEFAEHDAARFYDAHCATLWEEAIEIPLILKPPKAMGLSGVITTPVQLVDLLPTVLDLVGAPIPSTAQGRSLAPLLRGHDQDAPQTLISEATCQGPEWKALRRGPLKYISTYEVEGEERSGVPGKLLDQMLFDLSADPGEKVNLVEREPALARELRSTLEGRLEELSRAAPDQPATEKIDPELRRALEALGYIE